MQEIQEIQTSPPYPTEPAARLALWQGFFYEGFWWTCVSCFLRPQEPFIRVGAVHERTYTITGVVLFEIPRSLNLTVVPLNPDF